MPLDVEDPDTGPSTTLERPSGVKTALRGSLTPTLVPLSLRGRDRAGSAQRPVAVGVELGELAVDVDGVGAVEVDVLVVGRPDVGQDRVVDVAARRGAAR